MKSNFNPDKFKAFPTNNNTGPKFDLTVNAPKMKPIDNMPGAINWAQPEPNKFFPGGKVPHQQNMLGAEIMQKQAQIKVYNANEVLGTPDYTARNHNGHSAGVGYITDFCRKQSGDCWGSNGLNHGATQLANPVHIKAINLARTGLDSNDAANLFYVLRDFNFNLDIINLSGNNIGDNGVACMINGITCLNKQTLYKAPEWKPYAASFNTVQNVTILNLSNTNIGDKGVEVITDALVNGKIPATKYIDVSDNNIYHIGQGHLIKAVEEAPNDSLNITFVSGDRLLKPQGSIGHQALKTVLKSHLEYAASQGVHPNNIKVDKTFMDYFKQGGVITTKVVFGVGKCTTWPLGLLDTNMAELGIDVSLELLGNKTLQKVNTVVCLGMEGHDILIDQTFTDIVGEASNSDCVIF